MKCLMFAKSNNIKVKREIHEKIIFMPVVLTAISKNGQLSMKKKLVIY